MKLSRMVAVVALVGCGQSDAELGSIGAPIVDPATPYVGPSAPTLPPLAAHGRIVESTSVYATGLSAAHNARFTDGVDLAPPPVVLRPAGPPELDAWADAVGNPPDAAYLQPPALTADIRLALTSANAKMGSLSSDVLKLAADVFRDIPGFSSPDPDDPIQTFAGWLAPRARWQDAQWAFGPRLIHTPPVPETHYQYPTPAALALMPERGARLYCAAKELAVHQVKRSLGEKVLIPITVLHQDIDIGVFQPFAYVEAPEKYVGDGNDGAQAFNIPFQLGVKISPLRPFLPSLPELRYPLVLTTADSTLVTDTQRDYIWESSRCFLTYFCVPIVRPDFRQRYKTVAHVDSALTVGQSMHTFAKFPLFWAGPLFVQLQLGFGASVGTNVPPLSPDSSIVSRHSQLVYDDRLMMMQIPPPGWPTTIRRGGTSISEPYIDGPFYDGYWRLPQSYFNPDAGQQFYDVHSVDGDSDTIPGTVALGPQDPFRTAALEDDDHHLAPTSELAILGGLEGDIGFDASIAHLQITASGAFEGIAGLAHDVREGVSAHPGLFDSAKQPVTNLTITPVTYVSATLEFIVKFSLHIDLFIGHINVNYDIINQKYPFFDSEMPWSEEHTVRLGTASKTVAAVGDDPVDQPSFTSHTGSIAFPSFPHSVTQCLADPPLTTTVPTTCGSTPASGTPPHVESCVYTPISPQEDPCVNITASPQSCEGAKLRYMCGPTSKEQFYKGSYLLAHKLDLPATADGTHVHSDDLETFATMVRQCALEANPADQNAWFAANFTIAACDATATLVDPDTIVTKRTSDVSSGAACP